jgi:hypothetical protein
VWIHTVASTREKEIIPPALPSAKERKKKEGNEWTGQR